WGWGSRFAVKSEPALPGGGAPGILPPPFRGSGGRSSGPSERNPKADGKERNLWRHPFGRRPADALYRPIRTGGSGMSNLKLYQPEADETPANGAEEPLIFSIADYLERRPPRRERPVRSPSEDDAVDRARILHINR